MLDSLTAKKKRLAELFGVPLEYVPDDLDVGVVDMLAPRRPQMLAYTLDELERMDDPPWIMKGWVPNGLTVVYAKPKAGKTFWVMTLAICCAMGIPFFGRQLDGTGTVLYIAAEGSGKATWRRIARIAKSLGVDMGELRERMQVVAWGVKIDDPKSVADFLLVNPGKRDMVVVDTLARCMIGDENLTADMNIAVQGMDTIRREMQAASMIVIHHEGWKEERLRGAIALYGALDAQIHVKRKDGLNQVRIEELREAAVPDDNTMTFRLDKATGALVLIPTVEPRDRLQAREQKMWDVLDRLVKEAGRAVSVKEWVSALDQTVPDILAVPSKKPLSDEARRSQWRRSMEHMVKQGAVTIDDDQARPCYPGDDFNDEEDFGP
jgi:hypothetical protein